MVLVLESRKIKQINKRDKFYELVLLLYGERIKLKVSEDFLVEHKITKEASITDEVFSQLLLEEYFIKCVKQVSARLRTRKELQVFLEAKNLKQTEIDYLLDRLEKYHYINDSLFQKLYISSAISKGKGPLLIKHELIQHGINEFKIDLSTYTKELQEENIQRLKNKYPKKGDYEHKLYRLGYVDHINY